MPKNKKQYDDDDGRTIADMSDVSTPPLIVPEFRKRNRDEEPENKKTGDFQMTGSERRAFIGGALGAVLAIGSVFAIAGFLFILLLTKIL